LQKLPDGCELRPLDRQLFERSAARDFYSALYGSASQALERLRGRFVVTGDQICSEAYAYFAALGTIEIATATHEPYRRRGYATLACAALIQECERQGYQTYWNCASQNLASASLARKLGYCSEREYRLLAWFKRG
jgi:RimJ/RimL family protein N-acetyltransferase